MTDLGQHSTDDDRHEVEIVDDTLRADTRPTAQTAVAQRGPQVPSWVWALGGLVVVVLIIVATAQPSEPPTDPTPTTVPPSATFVPPTTQAPEVEDDELRFVPVGPPATLAPLEPFASTIPDDIPGELITFGSRGRLVVVDRSLDGPYELDTGSTNIIDPGVLLAPDQVIVGTGSRILTIDGPLNPDAEIGLAAEGNLITLSAGSNGRTISTTRGSTVQTASPLVLSGIQQWTLPTGVDVLGEWNGRLLVEAPGRVVLVDANGGETALPDVGQVLAYDGARIAHVTCRMTQGCRLNLGPPDDAAQSSVPLPEYLATAAADEWGASAAISEDGTRVAVSRDGGAPVPVVLDFTTGETWIVADGMNLGSPLAFSPDGEWLAYGFQSDVTVWRIAGDRSWRIGIGRPVGALAWR